MNSATDRIPHGRIELALHQLKCASGPPLLLLSALGASATNWPDAVLDWDGPVYGLDFAGHGESGWLKGGGYSPELFAADADAALAHLGDTAHDAHLVGAGIGAFSALLLAGGRPAVVKAALLLPGKGLGEGSGEPNFDKVPKAWAPLVPGEPEPGVDPHLARAAHGMWPRDYIAPFAKRARRLVLSEDGADRPGWWHVAAEEGNVMRTGPDLATALRDLAG